MFVGRERELASLMEFYEKDGIGMTVIYGRRRIGKSTLITEFIKDKKSIFYTATKVGKNRNLELFSKQVVNLLMPGVENIRTDGYLYDETRNLLTQEFSDISLVNNIVEQIASGENTLNTIAGKIGEKEQTVLYSLDKLINVGLIEKKKCINLK